MSKVRAPELKGEGFPVVPQLGPMHWALIGVIISGPVAEAATGQFVFVHQSTSVFSLLLGVPAALGLPESSFYLSSQLECQRALFLNTVP